MKPGVYYDMPEDEYRSIEAFCNSCIPYINLSPSHYHTWKEEGSIESNSMRLGTVTERYLLEPDKTSEFITQPETYPAPASKKKDAPMIDKPWSNNAHYCQDWNEEQIKDGFKIVKQDDIDSALLMVEKINSHPSAKALLDSRIAVQVVLIWEDIDFKVLCKCRIDVLTPRFLVDIKTTICAEPVIFAEKSCCRFGYHTQDAIYSDGWQTLHDGKKRDFVFIAVENTAPYEPSTPKLGEESQVSGRHYYKAALQKYARYINSGKKIHGYADDIVEVNIPMNKMELDPVEPGEYNDPVFN